MSKIILPGLYTEEIWKRGGSIPEHKKYIGKYYISWSSCESFNDKAGFNTGLLGEYEYILNKFCKVKFPDLGWGDYGSETEAYITLRDIKDLSGIEEKVQLEFKSSLINFSEREKKILNQIKPLGVFQTEICYYVEELDIVLLGYVDDHSPVVNGKIKMLRDYKTKSESSKKDLHDPKKHQIEGYILGFKQRGVEVQNAEYCIIERLGGYECMQGGGRQVLSVGDRIWYEPYSWDEDRLKVTHQMIIDTATKISSLYATYNKYFGAKKV